MAKRQGVARGGKSTVRKEFAPTELLERVRASCARLAPMGWHSLFSAHGLDITAVDLAAELKRQLAIDRSLPGFEDFAVEGVRGIENGSPASSLLYHAFASPGVVVGPEGTLADFPTPAEIQAVEDYVYGVSPPTLEDLRTRSGGAPLAIVVFAYEYRPAASTVHRLHADMCFARTGVARVGTEVPRYLSDARGYTPIDAANPRVTRVLPCRYGAYVAALMPGAQKDFGPMRFQTAPTVSPAYGAGAPSSEGDSSRRFWVPLHKLFSGSECLRGLELTVTLTAHHFNQKLRKTHRALAGQGYDTGWHEPKISKLPFIYSEYDGVPLGSFSSHASDGYGLLVPSPRASLVQLAKTTDGAVVTLKVPPVEPPSSGFSLFKSSLNINARSSGARSAPEYVHVRHKYDSSMLGGIDDLNEKPNIANLVGEGGYEAVHYVDFTADGWIQASCPMLKLEIPRSLPAFSVITPPDFFPLADQLELMQWWDQSAPPDLGASIWPANPGKPLALCDMRYPANLSYRTSAGVPVNDKAADFDNPDNDQTIFDPDDGTMTAIVAARGAGYAEATSIPPGSRPSRASMLPDGAAGVFAPGWDTSIDRTEESDADDNGVTLKPGKTFLTTYGLGSPFPEDAKLCAALSSYWPAAAPDVTRTFEPNPRYATATPLTDDVLGQVLGSSPWDGVPPRALSVEFPDEIEYFALDYGDYVQAALDNRFDSTAIAMIDAQEYVARTLVMARVYEAVGAKGDTVKETTAKKREWAVFSFRVADPLDPDLIAAQSATGKTLGGPYAYRFELYRPIGTRVHPDPAKFKKRLVKFTSIWKFFADPSLVLTDFVQDDKPPGPWRTLEF